MPVTPTWKIINYGAVPIDASTIEYDCIQCGRSALLPVTGVVIAQIDSGLVFDNDPHAMPAKIQCRRCRRIFEVD